MRVEDIKGIGPKKAKLLSQLGIKKADDLITHFPRAYENRSKYLDLDRPGQEKGSFRGTVISLEEKKTYGKKDFLTIKVEAQGHIVDIVFFNGHYMKRAFHFHADYIFYGKVERRGRRLQVVHPEFAPLEKEEDFARILPLYPLTKGLSQKQLRAYVEEALHYDWEYLPASLLKEHQLMDRDQALKALHFPHHRGVYKAAKYRCIFDELFLYLFQISLLKGKNHAEGLTFEVARHNQEHFKALLPYQMTKDQLTSLDEIYNDLASGRQMNRLLQGDVGSGKSTVAFAAMYMAAKNGYQAAYMAPTAILAQQQAETLSKLFKNTGFSIALLTSKTKHKKVLLDQLAQGHIDMVIGTQALLQDQVTFKNLGLVIADEQHRFGVNQREKLLTKGREPHYLLMSATPIPRTLSLMIYGDLSISTLKGMPKGRKPIQTTLHTPGEKAKVYDHLHQVLAKKEQAFIVYPLIEEQAELGLTAVTSALENIKREFSGHQVSMLHGQMTPEEKDEIMHSFSRGEIDLLLSTTVIEVGIDVPNATVMVIEHGERFGLSQLHQLRGRVGRGHLQSYCHVINYGGDKASERLRVFATSTDGFFIAEEDLRLRGPGQVFGTMQHGALQFKLADIIAHASVLKQAKTILEELQESPQWQEALDRLKALQLTI